LIPKKSLGQNFLIDKNICKKILNISNINNRNIIEVGPGKGILTDEIIKRNPKSLLLIEKDYELYSYLFKKYENNTKIKVVNIDALKYDYKNKCKKTIISNLPYNISIKLIINWLKMNNLFTEMILMIQKEVAEKMNYKKCIKKNRLNTLIEITSKFSLEFNVSKNVFYPKPKIMSSVVKIVPKTNINLDLNIFEKFTRELFKNKRKKLSNVININNKKIIKMNVLDQRAEDLNIKQILRIFNEFYNF